MLIFTFSDILAIAALVLVRLQVNERSRVGDLDRLLRGCPSAGLRAHSISPYFAVDVVADTHGHDIVYLWERRRCNGLITARVKTS
jgi:hypothetical protein